MSDQQKKREPPISMSLADVEADPELAARLTDKEKVMIAQGVPMGIAWFGPKHEIEKSVAFNMENAGASDIDLELFAQSLLPEIRKYFEDPKNVEEFNRWQEERENKTTHKADGKRRK